MHQDTSSPSFSSRNIFLMPVSFRRTASVHWVRQVQKKVQRTELGSVVFRQRAASISPVPSWPPWLLPPLFSLLIQAPQGCLAGHERRCRAVPSTPATAAVSVAPRHGRQRAAPRNGVPRTAQATKKLHVAVLSSVIAAEPSPWPEIRERALCRR